MATHSPSLAVASAIALAALAASTLLQLQQFDQRVQSIGYRLALHADAYCPAPVPLIGFVVHDLSLYDRAMQAEARAVFGLDDTPHILAVAAGSPAAEAGIGPEDALVSIAGARVPPPTGAAPSFARAEAVDAALAADAADGALDLGLVRNGVPRTVHLVLERGCASRFDVRDDASTDAEADGRYVQVTAARVASADSDDGLAIVLAHELAHNILGHRARLDAEHVRRGMLKLFGRNARLTRETELEADRLSIRLVIAAGYSPDAALAFRRRQWGTLPQQLLRAPTHPGGGERLAAMEQEVRSLATGTP